MDTDLKHIARISLVLRRVEYGFNIDENKQAVVDQLDLLNAAIAKLKMPQRRKMMDNEKYNRAFANLRFDLQSMINLSKSDLTWKNKLIKLRDQIFGSKLAGLFQKDNPQPKTSIVFLQFIRGITHFSHEKPYSTNEMIYHRNGSCSKSGTNNFNCNNTRNRAHHVSNTHLIEKCFIERLIYDQLWSMIEQVPQDIKHVEWLEKTRLAYKSCVPEGYIEVKIHDFKIMPLKLTVERRIAGVLVDVETYQKEWDNENKVYKEIVTCLKMKEISNRYYAKEQTYTMPTHWINLYPKKKKEITPLDALLKRWREE